MRASDSGAHCRLISEVDRRCYHHRRRSVEVAGEISNLEITGHQIRADQSRADKRMRLSYSRSTHAICLDPSLLLDERPTSRRSNLRDDADREGRDDPCTIRIKSLPWPSAPCMSFPSAGGGADAVFLQNGHRLCVWARHFTNKPGSA